MRTFISANPIFIKRESFEKVYKRFSSVLSRAYSSIKWNFKRVERNCALRRPDHVAAVGLLWTCGYPSTLRGMRSLCRRVWSVASWCSITPNVSGRVLFLLILRRLGSSTGVRPSWPHVCSVPLQTWAAPRPLGAREPVGRRSSLRRLGAPRPRDAASVKSGTTSPLWAPSRLRSHVLQSPKGPVAKARAERPPPRLDVGGPRDRTAVHPGSARRRLYFAPPPTARLADVPVLASGPTRAGRCRARSCLPASAGLLDPQARLPATPDWAPTHSATAWASFLPSVYATLCLDPFHTYAFHIPVCPRLLEWGGLTNVCRIDGPEVSRKGVLSQSLTRLLSNFNLDYVGGKWTPL